MGRQLPRSVTSAIRAQAALVVVSGLITVLTAVQRERARARRSSARAVARHRRAARSCPSRSCCWSTFALLAAVLLVFFRGGHPSARLSLTGLAVFFLFAMLVMYRQDPPGLFDVLAAVAAVLDVVLIYFLWHRDTNEFLRGAQLADEPGRPDRLLASASAFLSRADPPSGRPDGGS